MSSSPALEPPPPAGGGGGAEALPSAGKFGLSTQSPVDWSLRRVLQATRIEHTDVPLPVERSSGSRVRLPVRMTRLMLVAATGAPFDFSKARWPSLGVR